MKKLLSLILILTLSLLTLAGCYKSDYALMIGVHTSQSGASVTHTVAAIVIDKDYKIVSCRIDTIEIKAEFEESGDLKASEYKSKAEKGDSYNMVAWGGAKAEWYAQAQAFESYVVGKTREEVKNISTLDSGKAEDPTLTAGCTITVTDFMAAIEKAFASKHMVGFQTKSDFTLGVSVSASTEMDSETIVSYKADFGAVVVSDGKVLSATIDSKEVTSVVSDGSFAKIKDKGTKLEQGDKYGMVTYGNAKYEWYEQAQAFADSAIGVEIASLPSLGTEDVAGCSIYSGGYKNVLIKAASYAR